MGTANRGIDPDRLEAWLHTVTTTQPEEIDCEQLGEIIAEVVEAALAGADVRSLVPNFAVHIDHCPECREWYENLLEFTKENP